MHCVGKAFLVPASFLPGGSGVGGVTDYIYNNVFGDSGFVEQVYRGVAEVVESDLLIGDAAGGQGFEPELGLVVRVDGIALVVREQ